MQADLGGVFYEMAIRDHVRMDVLTRKAAELQRVDADLAQVERELRRRRRPRPGTCPRAARRTAAPTRFCASCGQPLAAAVRGRRPAAVRPHERIERGARAHLAAAHRRRLVAAVARVVVLGAGLRGGSRRRSLLRSSRSASR